MQQQQQARKDQGMSGDDVRRMILEGVDSFAPQQQAPAASLGMGPPPGMPPPGMPPPGMPPPAMAPLAMAPPEMPLQQVRQHLWQPQQVRATSSSADLLVQANTVGEASDASLTAFPTKNTPMRALIGAVWHGGRDIRSSSSSSRDMSSSSSSSRFWLRRQLRRLWLRLGLRFRRWLGPSSRRRLRLSGTLKIWSRCKRCSSDTGVLLELPVGLGLRRLEGALRWGAQGVRQRSGARHHSAVLALLRALGVRWVQGSAGHRRGG